VADLAVIVVSYNSRDWLEPCLRSIYEFAGGLDVDVVVVDNASTDGSAELVEERFPRARVIRGPNRGFAYGNNRGLEAVDAPFVLFMNPDAEIVSGTLAGLLAELRARPRTGLVGCRQRSQDDEAAGHNQGKLKNFIERNRCSVTKLILPPNTDKLLIEEGQCFQSVVLRFEESHRQIDFT